MEIQAYRRLVCPFCQTGVKRVEVLEYWSGKRLISQGVLWCDCDDQYPIIAGIAVFRRDAVQVVAYLRAGQIPRAVAQLTELRLVVRRMYLWSLRFLPWLKQWWPKQSNWYAGILQGMILAASLTGEVFSASWFRYLKDRAKRVSYALNLATAPLWQQLTSGSKQPTIIADLGAGGGDFTAHLAQTVPPKLNVSLYLVEKNFWLLYLAVMTGHLPQTVTPVVSDLEAHLPFADESCQGIMINDCLMYVDHQRAFLAEVARIAPTRLPGLLTAMHIHAVGEENIAQGAGVQPAKMVDWVPREWQGRIFDDEKLFKKLQSHEKVRIKPVSLAAHSWPVKKSFSVVGLLGKWSKSESSIELALNSTHLQDWIAFEDPEWLS